MRQSGFQLRFRRFEIAHIAPTLPNAIERRTEYRRCRPPLKATEVFLSSSDAIMIVIFLDLAAASAPRSSHVAKVLRLKQVLPAAAVLKRHGCFRRATNRATGNWQLRKTGKATTRPAAVARGAWNLLKAPSCACLANYKPKPNQPVELYQGAEWLWYL